MQRDLYEHYSSVGHCGFLEHVSITLTDRTDPSDPLKREVYWTRTFCTMAPYGLSIEDHHWSMPFKSLWEIYKLKGFLFCGRPLPH